MDLKGNKIPDKKADFACITAFLRVHSVEFEAIYSTYLAPNTVAGWLKRLWETV